VRRAPLTPPTLPTIRTVTIGLSPPHPLTREHLAGAAAHARRVEQEYRDAGYEVQTIRLTSRPVFEDLAGWGSARLLGYGRQVQGHLQDLGIAHLSLGPAPADQPGFPLDRLRVIEDLLADAPALTCTVQLGRPDTGVRADAAQPTAQIMLGLAARTERGMGNFRFAALAGVGPGHPFFPAGYHRGPDALTIGLQGAGIVAGAVSPDAIRPGAITAAVRAAMLDAAGPVVTRAERVAAAAGLRFGGIDLSPAPLGRDSIGAAIGRVVGEFGAPGTLAVAAAVTEALRSTGLPTCGYNGLMLPVLEDAELAAAWSAGRIGVHQLLSYSAVCGTGLDTLPLPGDRPAGEIAALLLDVATLAVRLGKPLSARLFPVPGKGSGDTTDFGSPYLVDIRLP
jgi:uncharacterized protein